VINNYSMAYEDKALTWPVEGGGYYWQLQRK